MRIERAGRAALTLLLAVYGFALLRQAGFGSWVDNIDLPIHETGHIVFSPFGDFMQFLGGTLLQIIIPCVFVGYFLRRRDPHAASVALWWVAQNFWNVSVYVRDARNRDLDPVVGGEHDWAYLLGQLGWMEQDQRIAHYVWLAGVIVFVVSIIGGLFALNASPKPAQAAEPAVG